MATFDHDPDAADRRVAADLDRTRQELRRAMARLPNDSASRDFLSRLDLLFVDANMLREYACAINLDGSFKIKNPQYFSQSIKLRIELLNSTLASLQEVLDLQSQQAFYATVVDEVAQESPECARRIMDRLNRLRTKRPEMIIGRSG